MAKKRLEKEFCTAIVKSMKEHGAFAYKIPDSPASYGDQRMRFAAPKRFDIFSIYKSVPVTIEAKAYKEFKGFGLNQLRQEQIDALNESQAAGAKPFVFLNIWIPRQENRCLIFEWSEFKRLAEMKCIPKKEIEAWPFLHGSKGLFPLKSWLESLVQRV